MLAEPRDTLKEEARRAIEDRRAELLHLSHEIHAHPETGFEEHQAAARVAEALEAAGFEVEREACGIPTALSSHAGNGPLNVAICAEYDALPAVGHACGHNVIAAAAVGAGIGLAGVADRTGLTVRVLGTPAEEGGGGKVMMLERGGFDGVHAALMVHPAPAETEAPPMLAATHVRVHYQGKEAHAAAFPELGVNAADALTIAQVAMGLMRQHIRTTDRLHGIVTKGGDAPNIVPARTSGDYLIRSRTIDELNELRPKVIRCFEAGALATGATLTVEEEVVYAQVENDPEIAALYRTNAEDLGRIFPPVPSALSAASTDFGNVSLAVAGIHPLMAIDSDGAVNHQPEFAAACVKESADKAVIDGAIAMAWTAIDLATDDELRARLMANPAQRPSA